MIIRSAVRRCVLTAELRAALMQSSAARAPAVADEQHHDQVRLRDLTQHAMGAREVDTLHALWVAIVASRPDRSLTRGEAMLALHSTEYSAVEAALPRLANTAFQGEWAADYLAATTTGNAPLAHRAPRGGGTESIQWALSAIYCGVDRAPAGSSNDSLPRVAPIPLSAVLTEMIACLQAVGPRNVVPSAVARALDIVALHHKPPTVSPDGVADAPVPPPRDTLMDDMLAWLKEVAATHPRTIVNAARIAGEVGLSLESPWLGIVTAALRDALLAIPLSVALGPRHVTAGLEWQWQTDAAAAGAQYRTIELVSNRIAELGLTAANAGALKEGPEVFVREALDVRGRVRALRRLLQQQAARLPTPLTVDDISGAFNVSIDEMAQVGAMPSLETKAAWVQLTAASNVTAGLELLRRVVSELQRKRTTDEREAQANVRMHCDVLSRLCERGSSDDLNTACGIIGTHKYFGLRVTKEMILPLLRLLAPKGDSRVFNLVDVCTLFSGNAIDAEVIAAMVCCARAAGDHHRAKALFTLLRDESPGVLTKLPRSCLDDLRLLKVLPEAAPSWAA